MSRPGGSRIPCPGRPSGIRPPSTGPCARPAGGTPCGPSRPPCGPSRTPCPARPSTCPPKKTACPVKQPPCPEKKPPLPSDLPDTTPIQKKVFQDALTKSAMQPKKTVQATGSARKTICAPTIQTKRGPEQLVRQVCVKKEVQRTPKGEYINRYAKATTVDQKGQATEIEYTAQKINPAHATESLGVNEVVAVTSCISQTTGGKQRHKTIKKKTSKSQKLASKVNMNPAHINRLIKEESEDVENTLKMVPPELASNSTDRFPMKKRLQKLRLNAESVALLEKASKHLTPAADEAEAEATPEAIADILTAFENGVSPKNAPDRVFNTLFPVAHDERITVSPVAGGYFQDIVVPTDVTPGNRGISIDDNMNAEMETTLASLTMGEQETLIDNVATGLESPAAPEFSFKGEKIELTNELPPWNDEEFNLVTSILGAEAYFHLGTDPDFSAETKDEYTKEELSDGLDYYLDADTVPFENKVQLRGSRLPNWFPGYMAAFPHLPELVKVNRSPSGVLHTAWKAVQPKLFPDESVLIM